MTSILQVLSIDLYDLLDPGATLSFTNPLITRNFYILPDILNKLLMVTTPIGELVVVKRVYRTCPIRLPNKVTHLELVEIVMVNFDVKLGMDWLNNCFPSIDC